VAREEEGVRAQLTPAIHPLQVEELDPLQEAIRPLQVEGLDPLQVEGPAPILPILATHHPPTLLEMGSHHLLGLPGATTLPPPAQLGLDILLPLLIPMQLQEITRSMMTTVNQQTQVTVPPQLISMMHLGLVGQSAMGMQLQKSTPVTWTTPLGVTLMVALSIRAGEARV
jgi:hypothetical protein